MLIAVCNYSKNVIYYFLKNLIIYKFCKYKFKFFDYFLNSDEKYNFKKPSFFIFKFLFIIFQFFQKKNFVKNSPNNIMILLF